LPLFKLSETITVAHEAIPAFLFCCAAIDEQTWQFTLNSVSIYQGEKPLKKKKGVLHFAERKLEGDVTISRVGRARLRTHRNRTLHKHYLKIKNIYDNSYKPTYH
jgi:hypothetical protein